MPIYEFLCPACNRVFNFLSRGASDAEKTPSCPKCGGKKMRRQLSTFAHVRGGSAEKPGAEGMGASGEGGGGPPVDDARMDRAMAALEGEMAGFDDENPDPRKLGRFMRRMAELTGENMPAEIHEAVRRLEAGEDPEKIEKEMGGLLGGEGDEGGGRGGAPPTQDEGLYGM